MIPGGAFRDVLAPRYAIEHEIGRGGMATVYHARDLRHGRSVAIKILHPAIANAISKQRFLREIEIAAQLTHPNILPLHDSGEAAGVLYYVMPFVEGRTLRDLLAERGALPLDEALRLTAEVADALDYAHAQQVVHRDIKPANILLVAGHPVIADFGIARAMRAATSERSASDPILTDPSALGTPAYMSPEQMAGDSVDHRTDIYSLGIVLHEMLTGERPGTPAQKLRDPRQNGTGVFRLRAGGKRLPRGVRETLRRALARDPEARFPRAADFARSLRPARFGTTRAVVAGTAVVGLALVIAAIGRPFGAHPTEPPTPGLPPRAKRVVVAEFTNQTKQRELDYLGVMAADWITVGLQRTGFVDVVPTPTALQASRFVDAEAAEHKGVDPVRQLANETNAGIVVTGYYYRVHDRLEIQIQVTNADSAKLIDGIGPIDADLDAPSDAIVDAKSRVMGLLSTALDSRLASSVEMNAHPPTFEAYRDFAEGLDAYVRNDFSVAASRFANAFGRDTTFSPALLMASISYSNGGAYARADSILDALSGSLDQLDPHDRDWFEYRRSLLKGDRAGALRAVRAIAAIEPGTKATYNLAVEAMQNGYLHEAEKALLGLPPDRGAMRGWAPYWDVLGRIQHLLGHYQDELATGKRGREAFPTRIYTLGPTIRALAALGRVDDLRRVLGESTRLPIDPAGTTPADLALAAGLELRAHDHAQPVSSVLNAGISWLDDRSRTAPLSRAERFTRGRLLYALGRWKEAEGVGDSLVSADFTNADYLGLRGASAARVHDTVTARRDLSRLEAFPRSYNLGVASFAAARVAAVLGQRDTAVALLRRSLAEGHEYDVWAHREPDLESLHSLPEYQAMVRIKD